MKSLLLTLIRAYRRLYLISCLLRKSKVLDSS